MGRSHHQRDAGERELTRDELFVAPGVGPLEWRRDNALFQYRLIKRTGWVGRVFGWMMIAGICFALVMQLISGFGALFMP